MKIKEFLKNNKSLLCLGLFIFSFSLFLVLFFTKESDYFWHIKAGEYMFNNHTVLTKDIFSWFMNGKSWMSHEWLFEVVLYGLKTLFGNYHMIIYIFGCLVFLNLFLFLSNKKEYLKNIPFTMFWIFLSMFSVVFLQARPHMISFIFLTFTIYVTYDLYNNKDSRKIYLLPLVALLWANFHGGSSNLSYLFCLGFMFIGLFKFNFSKIECKRLSKKQFVKYGVVSILCLICICFNPHGISMVIYPYSNLMDTLMVSSITEWQPTVLNNIQHYPYFILAIILLLTMIFSKKKIQLIDLALFGVGIFLGLKSVRFWFYLYIIMTYCIFKYIPKRKIDYGTNLCLIIFSFILIVIFGNSFDSITDMTNKHYVSNKMINTIKEVKPNRLFNPYDNGGELIYNDIDVFVDGRADLYSKYNLEDYLDLCSLNGNYYKLLDKYDFDYLLVSKKFSLNTLLKNDSNYSIVVKDKNLILYKKN